MEIQKLTKMLVMLLIICFCYALFLLTYLRLPNYSFNALFRAKVLVCVAICFILASPLWLRNISWSPIRFSMVSLLSLIAIVAIALTLFNVVNNHTALKIAFQSSRTSFENTDNSLKLPLQFGLFMVLDRIDSNETTFFVTTKSTSLDDGAGFIYIHDPEIEINADDLGLKRSMLYQLEPRWYVYFSRYKNIKLGWS